MDRTIESENTIVDDLAVCLHLFIPGKQLML